MRYTAKDMGGSWWGIWDHGCGCWVVCGLSEWTAKDAAARMSRPV
jgi:hypothetical protein